MRAPAEGEPSWRSERPLSALANGRDVRASQSDRGPSLGPFSDLNMKARLISSLAQSGPADLEVLPKCPTLMLVLEK
jgi:hypothetical protein